MVRMNMTTFYILLLLFATQHSSLTASSVGVSQKNGVHTYDFEIHESGTDFTERVTIDEDRNLEIIEVPSHNDVTGATYIHDFNLNVTLRREVDDGRCYLSDLSRDIQAGLQPAPRDLLAAINGPKQENKQDENKDSNKIETVAFKWTVGAAVTGEERAAFGAEMRELCDGQTIHRLDRMDDSVTVHEEASGMLLSRTRRQVQDGDMVGTQCPMSIVASRCIVKLKNCRYTHLINCEKTRDEVNRRMVVNCLSPTFAHIYDRINCCMDCCTVAARADTLMPHCDAVTEAQVREFSFC